MTAQTTVDGFTCLHLAIKQGHKNTVQYLLSLKEGRCCLDIKDNFGRLPSYYANVAGNESIYNEFFVNNLSIMLGKSLYTTPEIEQKCSELLINHGESYGCYSYDDITNMDIESGETLLMKALLNGNMHYIKALLTMKTDLYKKDDIGVSSAFWMKYLGYDKELSLDLVDDETTKMVGNVMKVAGKNMQNKMLINLASKTPLLIGDESFKMLPLVKMSDGYDIIVKDTVIKSLKSLKSVEHSLLGFIEKFNQNKIVPIGKQNLEYLMWDAKVAMIKRLAINENEKLEPRHMVALYLYTSNLSIFQQVNKILQNWNNKDNKIWEPFVASLYQGIELLPPFVGECYRSVNMQFNPALLAIGNVLQWNTFSLASKNYTSSVELINDKKGIVFIIKSKNGKYLGNYTKTPVDDEIIFLPGSCFKVNAYYNASIIALGQANIRNTTFVWKPEYMLKVMDGKSSIIIEVEEVEGKEKMEDIKESNVLSLI
jgi:hypothetical protein